MTSYGRGFQGSRDLLHGNVYTKVYGELINFAASYSCFIGSQLCSSEAYKMFSSVQLDKRRNT